MRALLAFALLGICCQNAAAQVHVVYHSAPVLTSVTPVVYQPVVAYRPMTVVRPAPVVYSPPVVMAPTPVLVTRRRPLLGGTVTRVRNVYRPTLVAPAPVTTYFVPAY